MLLTTLSCHLSSQEKKFFGSKLLAPRMFKNADLQQLHPEANGKDSNQEDKMKIDIGKLLQPWTNLGQACYFSHQPAS